MLGLAFKARHRRRARLALAQADPPARARAGRRRASTTRVVRDADGRFDEAVATPTSVVVATNHSAFDAGALRAIAEPRGRRLPGRRPVERARRRPGLRLRRRGRGAAARVSARPRHRRRRHDRRGRRAPAAARPRLRGPRLRPARRRRTGCARAARSTAATCASSTRRARRPRGCTHVIHLAAIVGGIANFHKLPHTLTEVNNALYNAVFRAALDEDVERFVYVSLLDGLRAREQFPTTEDYLRDCPVPRSAYGFSKLDRRGLLPRRARRARAAVHDLPPVQRLRAGRDARGRAGHRPRGAGPDPQVARAASGRCRSSAPASRRARSRTSTTSPTAIVTAMGHPAGAQRGLQHLGRATS